MLSIGCDRPKTHTSIINDEQDYYLNPLNQYLKTRRSNRAQLKDKSYERLVLNRDEFATNYLFSTKGLDLSTIFTELDTRYKGCNYTVGKFVEYNDTRVTKIPTDAPAPILEDLIANCGLPLEYTNKIASALQDASALISSRRVEHNIQYELFIDYEFPDWKMIKITFNIDVDFTQIRDEFKEPVYRAISSKLPDHILENIIIKFDSL